MNRREAAKVTAGLLASAIVPGWIREAFGDEPPRTPEAIRAARDARVAACRAERERAAAIRNAYQRAKEAGKPLLVLLVPSDNEDRRTRGYAFGQFLSLAPNEWLSDLALCEVVCREAIQLTPIADEVRAPEPLMLLIETGTDRPETKVIEGQIPPEVRLDGIGYLVSGEAKHAERQNAEAAERRRCYEESVSKRIATLGTLIRGRVSPDSSTLSMRADQATGSLDLAVVKRIYDAIDKVVAPPIDFIDRAAAIIRLHAEGRDPETRAVLLGWLAAAARARLVDHAPHGSRWGISGGCGASYYTSRNATEDDYESTVIGCGMGSVPHLSGRFLDFYTRPQS